MLIFRPKPLYPEPEIIGSLAVSGITTQSIAVGFPIGVQLLSLSQSVLTEPFQTLLPLIVTVVSSVSVKVEPSHSVYVIAAVYVVVEVGQTFIVSLVPTIGPEVPDPSYHVNDVIEVPEGVNLQASFVVVQSALNPFLFGATTAVVAVAVPSLVYL